MSREHPVKGALLFGLLLVCAIPVAATSIPFGSQPTGAACAIETDWGCEMTAGGTFGSTGQWTVGTAPGAGPNLVGSSLGTVDFVPDTWFTWAHAEHPGFVIDLSGSNLGAITTTLSGLTPGLAYELAFSYSYNPDDNPHQSSQIKQALVTMTNAGSVWSTGYTIGPYDSPSANADHWGPQIHSARVAPQWYDFTQVFTPANESVVLTFASEGARFQGIVLADNIAYYPTPEPLTLSLCIAGLALILLKRKQL